jgi:hypothetical protein
MATAAASATAAMPKPCSCHPSLVPRPSAVRHIAVPPRQDAFFIAIAADVRTPSHRDGVPPSTWPDLSSPANVAVWAARIWSYRLRSAARVFHSSATPRVIASLAVRAPLSRATAGRASSISSGRSSAKLDRTPSMFSVMPPICGSHSRIRFCSARCLLFVDLPRHLRRPQLRASPP